MGSLQHRSLAAVLKFALVHRSIAANRPVAPSIQRVVEEFHDKFESCKLSWDVPNSLEQTCELSWSSGQWTFLTKVEGIQQLLDAGMVTYMGGDWSSVFGLAATQASMHCFTVTDYNFDLAHNVVAFHGIYL